MTDESNRRIADRHAAYMGAEVTTPTGKIRSAITQDASATGFLLLTRAKLEVGTNVSVRVFLPGPGDSTEVISATVVRREPDRKSTRLNSSHVVTSRMPSSA